MMLRFIIWVVLFYLVYRFIRITIQGAVKKGIRDYEAQKETQRRKEKEVRIDRKKVEDAKFKDLE